MVNDNSAPKPPKKAPKLTQAHKEQDMFTSLDAVKDFILWAKANGLSKVKIGNIEAEISDVVYALATTTQSAPELQPRDELSTTRTWAADAAEQQDPKTDDEDLFWSSGS